MKMKITLHTQLIQSILILTFFTSTGFTYAIEKREIKNATKFEEIPGRSLQGPILFGPILVMFLIIFDMFVMFFCALLSKYYYFDDVNHIFFNDTSTEITASDANYVIDYNDNYEIIGEYNNNNNNEEYEECEDDEYSEDYHDEEPNPNIINRTQNPINSTQNQMLRNVSANTTQNQKSHHNNSTNTTQNQMSRNINSTNTTQNQISRNINSTNSINTVQNQISRNNTSINTVQNQMSRNNSTNSINTVQNQISRNNNSVNTTQDPHISTRSVRRTNSTIPKLSAPAAIYSYI